jgi:ABC-type branched-subunit amino acid transport system ATPase component
MTTDHPAVAHAQRAITATSAHAESPAVVGAESEAAVAVRNLVKRFDRVETVRGVSFQVGVGEAFAFLGPNGAGKSTTISILCTLLRPTSGTVRVAGINVADDPLGVRRLIGLVFQDPTLDEYLTAEENLRFHAELYRVPHSLIPGPSIRCSRWSSCPIVATTSCRRSRAG